MAGVETWSAAMLLAAFAGGAFGAAVGALQSFSFAGLVVILGELSVIVARAAGVETLPVDVTGAIGFGVVLGPHVAFAGGAGAVAYAARREYLDADFAYHDAKAVTRGLGGRPDVLFVGGVFGCIGYLVATVSAAVPLPVDPVALGVVGSAFAHRLVLGYSLIGTTPGRVFDMNPAGSDATDGASTLTDGRGQTVEPWLPYQYRWRDVLGLGVVFGVLGGYLAYLTASPFLAFGLSVVVLAFLCAGVDDIPVTHHITLPASTAVLALVGTTGGQLSPELVGSSIPLEVALVVGAVFGVLGGILGEVAQRIFYAHAETHLDPPAASIVVTSALIGLLAMTGVLEFAVWIPTP